MAEKKLTRNVFLDFGTRFEGLERKTNDLGPLLNTTGEFLVKQSVKSFQDQKKQGGKKWQQRGGSGKVKNIAGLLEDFRVASKPKSRRFEARPAVIDTGRLRMSIAKRIDSNKSVVIGTTVPYAEKQLLGGKVKIEITKPMRKRFVKWLFKQPDEVFLQLLFLKNAEAYETEVKATNFLFTTPFDIARIKDIAERFFSGS